MSAVLLPYTGEIPPTLEQFREQIANGWKLPKSQRAVIAAELETAYRASGGMEEWRAHRKTHVNEVSLGLSKAEKRKLRLEYETRAVCARLMRVSRTTVAQAIVIKKADPAVFELVRAGDITMNAAYEKVTGVVRRLKYPARAMPESGGVYHNRRANTAKRRMILALSQAQGLARGLGLIDMTYLLQGLDDEEVKVWTKIAHESATRLRAFEHALKAGLAE